MELLNIELRRRIIQFALTMLVLYGIVAALMYQSKNNPNSPEFSFESMLCSFGAGVAFLILLMTAILVSQAAKSKKKAAMLSQKENEQLKDLVKKKESLCDCYFLEQHLVSIRALKWTVVPYDNIRSAKQDCDIYKSNGISTGKSFSLVIAVKEGTPAAYIVPCTKKKLDREYEQFVGKLAEYNPDIYEADVKANYR